MITYFSDLNLVESSGYVNLGIAFANALSEKEKVIYFGLEYQRQEHPYKFSAIPLPGLQHIVPMVNHLNPRYSITALDIPLQIKILEGWNQTKVPYVGIFPVEAEPLTPTWAANLWKMKKRFVISEYGAKVCAAAGLDTIFLPPVIDIGDNSEIQWKRAGEEERKIIRTAMHLDKKFVILTVADNHERKNLSRAMEIIADLIKKGLDVQYFLVTRTEFVGGWILSDLVNQLGLTGHVQLMRRGMPHAQLRALYAAADLTLLTSKSEGACLPVLESMAVGTPVAATDCTALHDHLIEGRGLPVNWDYKIIDPFGNAYRYFISKDAAVDQIMRLADMSPLEKKEMTDKAFEYASSFSLDRAMSILQKEVENI